MTKAGQDNSERSVSRNVARRLREEILRVPDGTFLGSEEELIARLGVSRPTFRQVARLLEHEQILVIKRGVKGGCYTRRPQAAAVAAAAALYLRTEHTNLRQLFGAAHGLTLEAVRLACASTDRANREALRSLIQRFKAEEVESQTIAKFMADESAINAALLALAANPPIELFLKAIYHFGRYETDERLYADRTDRLTIMKELRIKLGEAILAHDTDMAILIVKRRASIVVSWLNELPDRELALRLMQT